MEIVFDVETTMTPSEDWKEGQSLVASDKSSPSPYLPTNELVSIHAYVRESEGVVAEMLTFFQEDLKDFQGYLNNADRLIAFNAKFDVAWIRECGFVYDREIYDVMLVEYLLHGGTLIAPSLNDVCGIYGLEKKKDKVKEYWQKGINTNEIPREIIKEYGEFDVCLTNQIYEKQLKQLS